MENGLRIIGKEINTRGEKMLILSSYGFESPVITDKLLKTFSLDEKILIIPFAGFDNAVTAKKQQKFLEDFGFKKENIFVCTLEEPLKYFNENIDLIYVPGGNPFKLLKEAHNKDLIPKIRELIENGVTYFGVSSGADFLCEDLTYLKNFEDDDFNLTNCKGLGVIKENILCHADQRGYGDIKILKEADPEKEILLIRNDEVYIINGE